MLYTLLKIKHTIINENNIYLQTYKTEEELDIVAKEHISDEYKINPYIKNIPINSIFLKLKEKNYSYQYNNLNKIIKYYKLLYSGNGGEIFFAESKYFKEI